MTNRVWTLTLAAFLTAPLPLFAEGHETLMAALPDRFIAYVFEEAESEKREGNETGIVSVTSLKALRNYVPEEVRPNPYALVGMFGWLDYLRHISNAERFDCPLVGENSTAVSEVAAFQGFFAPVFEWTMVNDDAAKTAFQTVVDMSPNQRLYQAERAELLQVGLRCGDLKYFNRIGNRIATSVEQDSVAGTIDYGLFLRWLDEETDVDVESAWRDPDKQQALEDEWFDAFVEDAFAGNGQIDARYEAILENPEYAGFEASYHAAINAAATTIPAGASVVEISMHNWGNIAPPDKYDWDNTDPLVPFPRDYSEADMSEADAPAAFYGIATIDWRLPGPRFGTSFAFNHLTACEAAQAFPAYLQAGWQRVPEDGENKELEVYLPMDMPPVLEQSLIDDQTLCATVFSSSVDLSDTEFAGQRDGINPVYLTSYQVLENFSNKPGMFLK